MARSGVAAARLCAQLGARVRATDVKAAQELGEDVTALAELGVTLELGGHRSSAFTAADLVVVSPGVPWERPELEAARRAGVPVVAELELGAAFVRAPVAAVTGTKGKSTTTAALGAMLAEAGFDARVGGNIGRPLTGLLDGQSESTRFALEASSFQLEGTRDFHPRVAVFLNLSADHLDRHPSFEAYARAKARIFAHQTADDWAVVSGDDARVAALARAGRARVLPFFGATAPAVGDAAYFEDGRAWLRLDGRAQALFARADVRLPGAHLACDLLAAAAAARLMGAAPDAIARAVAAFEGLENVLEPVGEKDGVRWFNDTKATNVDAARKSLEAFAGPLHVIMGGRYKGGDFADLAGAARGRVRRVLAIGEARPLIRAGLGGVVEVVECDSLRAAVLAAHAAARPGDTVLLAPACSSFDMFRDYAERGRAFKAEVTRVLGHG
jgi:UDP-N-acetylmuramoylalanine--D-glutamate ligase